MGRVFVDTNVLFPFSVMDLLLALTEDAVHEVIWTDALLDEWKRVIVREEKRSEDTAASVTTAIRDFFADSKIARDDYEHLLGEMPGDDPDDHVHMAAAVAGGATVLLTRNARDFPTEPLAARGLRVTDPDTYLSELASELPDEVADTLVRLADEKQKPPKTAAILIDDLDRAGVPRFAATMRGILSARGL